MTRLCRNILDSKIYFFEKLKQISCLTLAIILICTNYTISQGEWVLCPDETVRETKLIVKQIEGYSIAYEIRNPTCPQANDGLFRLVSIFDNKNFKSLDSIAFGGFAVDKLGEYLLAGGPGGQTFSTVSLTLHIKFGNRHWATKDSMVIKIGEPLMPLPSEEPKAVTNLQKSKNETCPGDMDGVISLFENPKFNSPAKILWGNGFEGFHHTNLSAGIYPYTYEKEFVGKKCCKTDKAPVKTNKCISELFNTQFDGQIPLAWFNPDGNYMQEKNHGAFNGDGCLYIPLDFSSDDMAMALRLTFVGAITVEIIDEYFNTLAITSIEGVQDIALPLDEINIPNPHVYIKITAEDGTELYDLDVFTFDEYLDFTVFLKGIDHKNDRRDVQEDVCVGDIIFPGTKISIEGGITPFTFNWDLDGDMIFDDVDSLYHEFEITSEGLTELALKIEDFVGHLDTVYFEYNALQSDQIKIGVPALLVEESNVNLITVCEDENPFEIRFNMPNLTLSASGEGLSGMTFDPSSAGIGYHLLLATGDFCDVQAGLSINVIQNSNVAINDLPPLYTCSNPVDLSTLINEGAGGIWVLNDTIYIFNDTLINDQSMVGPNNLRYEIGGGHCLTTVSIPFEVLPAPIANLEEPTETIDPGDPLLDLNQFLGTSTSGGEWSGEHVLDGFFNPSGLANGYYDVTYTVGEDGCTVFEIISIEVKMVTATFDENLEGLKIFPVPSRDYIQVCSEVALPKTYKIYNSFGKLMSTSDSVASCMKFDLTNFTPGCYFLNIQSANSHISKIFVVVN